MYVCILHRKFTIPAILRQAGDVSSDSDSEEEQQVCMIIYSLRFIWSL